MFRPRKRKPSEKKQRSPEFYARQATRTVRSRTFWLMLVMGILLFVILFFQLYHLQITRHQEMQTRALDQQTRQTVVSAFRGTIYDRNGTELAVSATAEYTSTPSFSASFWPLMEMEAGAAVTPTGAAAASVL